MSPKRLLCFIFKFPSLTNSKDPAKIPALPVRLNFEFFLKFCGMKSSNFLQSIN